MHPNELGAQELLANLSIGYVVLAAFVLTAIRLVLVPSRTSIARSLAELVESLIIAGVLVFLIIRPFFLQAFFIPSESMEPTLMGHDSGFNDQTHETYPSSIHDHIFVDKLSYRFRDPKPGEIIVFRAEKKADKQAEYEHREPVENVLIKRLIAIGPAKVEVKHGSDGKIHVFRNDVQLNEPVADSNGVCHAKTYCIREDMSDPQSSTAEFAVNGPLDLKPGQLFVMGDNRNNSNDSRFWGTLPRNRVIGRAVLIFWPLNRIRILH